MKPAELVTAEMVIDICHEFHCLPSQLMSEDIEFLRMLSLVRLAKEYENG